jgi:flagellar hook-associated protein 3 FlgL
MRVTNSMMSSTITRYLMRQSENLYKLQEVISSQKRINRPSDDPVGMRKVLDYRSQMSTINQYMDNVERGTTRLEFTEITLDMVDDLLSVIREISQTQAKGTTASRSLAAREVRNMYDQAVELANAKLGKTHLFSGHQTDMPAYGHFAKVSGGTPVNLDFGLSAVATSVTIEIKDDTGAVIDTITPAGPWADGFNSVSWNPAVIPADGIYQFTVTASNAGGDIVDYATYNGDSGDVRIVLGESTEMAIDADGRNIFTPAGKIDVFEVMADLIFALENDDEAGIDAQTMLLDDSRTQVNDARAASAPKMFQLESTGNFWANYKPKIEEMLSNTEDADLNETVMQLNQVDLAYQTTIATAARIIRPGLIDFLK